MFLFGDKVDFVDYNTNINKNDGQKNKSVAKVVIKPNPFNYH